MTKKETWDKISKALIENKIKEGSKLYVELEKLLAPKNRILEIKEPILNEDGSIKELWCNKHLKYEPVELFAKKSKEKTGYDRMCKASAKLWWAYTNETKEIKAKIVEMTEKVLDGKITIEVAKKKRAEMLKTIDTILVERDTLPYK